LAFNEYLNFSFIQYIPCLDFFHDIINLVEYVKLAVNNFSIG